MTNPPSMDDFGVDFRNHPTADVPAMLSTLVTNLMVSVGEDFAADLAARTEFVAILLSDSAGIPRENRDRQADRRLRQPGLKTTYPACTARALTSLVLELRSKLADSLPTVLAEILKLQEAEFHLQEVFRLEAMYRQAKQAFKQERVFPSVVAVAQALYEGHGVTHRHWAAVSDSTLSELAALLRKEKRA